MAELDMNTSFLGLDGLQLESEKKMRKTLIKEKLDEPLEVKIRWTKARVLEWINHWGLDNVALAFSGGKDSTVLAHIIAETMEENNIEGKMDLVFSNTGIEYPELVQFVKRFSEESTSQDADVIKLKRHFKLTIVTPTESQAVLYKKQIPAISKEISQAIYEIRNSMKARKTILYRLGVKTDKLGNIIGLRGFGGISKKWLHFIDKQFVPYEVGGKCCSEYKKKPTAKLKQRMIVGTMAYESRLRRSTWLKRGCNAFDGNKARSAPISLWVEEDVWNYIEINKIKLADSYTVHGYKRTGCYNCPYPLAAEEAMIKKGQKAQNKYEMLKETHPGFYKISMGIIGFRKVLLDMKIKIRNDDEYMLEQEVREKEIDAWHENLEVNMNGILDEINERLTRYGQVPLSDKDRDFVMKERFKIGI